MGEEAYSNRIFINGPIPKTKLPGVDALIDLANENYDPKVRKEAIEKANKLVYDFVYLGMAYIPIKVYGVRKNVKWVPRADETICFSAEDDKS